MRLALPLSSSRPATVSGGLLLRMCSWLAAVCPAYGEPAHEANAVAPPVVEEVARDSAILLPFPIRGEALLVKLAELLRVRIAACAPSQDSFLLTMSRAPHSCLIIDGAAHVEFHAGNASYHLVIELVQDTMIKVETTDFDTVVKFVAQYVADRLSDTIGSEAAS